MAKADAPGDQPEPVTMANTKREMLAAYKQLLKRLEGERKTAMKPEKEIRQKQDAKAVEAADALSTEGIGREIGKLKSEIGRVLGELSDKMEDEVAKYLRVKRAVEIKEKELEEIYEIQKQASSLAALIEAQKEKRETFDAQMAEQKEELEYEIEATREEWKEEQAAHEAEIKERDAAEKKQRDREAEEHKYKVAREKQLAKEDFEYEKAKLQREIQLNKEEMERDLAARQKALSEGEAELEGLRQRAAAFPGELEATVSKAVAEATERVKREADVREELLKKDAEGERNVLNSRIEALQQTVAEQSAHVARLSAQIEKSYTQVQDIAVKAIEGSATVKGFAALQAQPPEPPRRSAQADE